MQTYFVSYVKEDNDGIGFGYRVFEQFKQIKTYNDLKDLSAFLKKYENNDTIILINILNMTKGI